MKKILLLIFLYLTVISCGQNIETHNDNYLKYPTIIEVIDEFFDDYQFEEYSISLQNQFQKKPDGWHIVTQKYNNRTARKWDIIQDELFWSLEKEKFNEIDYPTSEGGSKQNKKEYIDGFSKKQHGILSESWNRYYNIYPYYGYDEAGEDVIKLLEDSEDLPDSTLYALARCYSDYSSNLLSNQFDLVNTKNCLSEEQLKKYRYYTHKSNEKFNEVYEINPNFETKVGSIHTKWSNEHISAWINLRVYQNEEEAKKEIIDDLYDPLIIDVAKNYLMSCEKDAILFTNGDSDTYPLHYVQEQLGFRKDVLIVNISLLGSTRNINSYKEKINEAIPMPSSIDYPHKQPFSAKIQKGRESECINAIKEIKYKNESPENIKLPINTNIIPVKDLIEWEDKDILSSINFKIKSGNIYQHDIALLDILANFGFERPIYFIHAQNKKKKFSMIGKGSPKNQEELEKYIGLLDFVQEEGVVSRLVPFRTNYAYLKNNNTDKSYDLMMNKYNYSNIQNIQEADLKQIVGLTYSYLKLAKSLLLDGEYEKSILVADKYFETFPTPTKWNYRNIGFLIPLYEMMNVYVKTNQEDEYYRIDEMIKTCTKKKDELESLKNLKTDDEMILLKIKDHIQKFKNLK